MCIVGDVKFVWLLKFVVDVGNGVVGLFVMCLFKVFGCEFVECFIDIDGMFLNYYFDFVYLENL